MKVIFIIKKKSVGPAVWIRRRFIAHNSPLTITAHNSPPSQFIASKIHRGTIHRTQFTDKKIKIPLDEFLILLDYC
jgi:hypothetical protein